MSIKLDSASVAGSIVKAGVTAAAAAAFGPVAGIAVAAGVDTAVTEAITKAFSDAAGSALKVSSGDPNLEQRVSQAVSSSLWSAFDKVEHDEVNPCVIIRPVRRAIIASATSGGGLAKVAGDDGKQVLRGIVASACNNDPNADISTDVQERIVNAFFDELVRKMQNDALMSNLLIYRTLGQGFGVLYQQLYGVAVRLDSIESMLKDVSAATAGQSEFMRLLQALQFRSDERLSLGGTDSGADAFREELCSALQEILEKSAGDAAPRIPLMLTQRPMVRKFVGRTKELEEVEGLLEHNQLVAIRADGGVGKTAIAARLVSEFVRRVTDGAVCSYRHFAWVRFTGKLLEDLSAIEVPGVESATGDERAEVVQRWLRTTDQRTLLIIDNMDEHPGDTAEDILMRFSPSVRVLITTRVTLDFAEEYPLGPMGSDQALQMLYAYYLDERAPRPIEEIESRPDCQAAKEIVNRADSNALLVELIARAARSEGGDLAAYWRAHEEKVFAEHTATLSTGYARSRGLSDDLTLNEYVLRLYELSAITDEQRRIMALLAQFPSNAPIYYKVREWSGFVQDDMNRLVELGWVEWDTQRYMVHAVVRESVLAQLDANNVIVNPSEYGELVDGVIDVDDYLNVAEGYEVVRERMVVPETIVKLMETSKRDELSLATLHNNLGTVCQAEGDYAAARSHHERALAIREWALGPDHPDVATSHNNLGIVCEDEGDYAAARAHHERALAIRERALGPDHPDVATSLNNLGLVCRAEGDYAAARAHFERDLAISERALGPDHPDVAASLGNLGLVCEDEGDYAAARAHHERALAIRERALGPDHPDVATSLGNLGTVCEDEGDYAAARAHLERALAIQERALGPDHPDVATSHNNLGTVCEDEGDYAAARAHLERALQIFEHKLGPNHPYTRTVRNNLYRVLKELAETSAEPPKESPVTDP